jgi:hypothetical protein
MNNGDQPAFPTHAGNAKGHGFTKREEYAKAAMQALLQDERTSRWLQEDQRYTGTNFKEVVAINAFEFADAMIAESNKTE